MNLTMKTKLLFLLLSLVTVSPIEGQNVYTDYHPLVENGKKWTYKVSNPDSSPGYFEDWNDIYYLDGDTIVGSVPCLQLFVTSNRSASSPIRNYLGAIYENQGKVYFFISGSRTPELLYDFSSVESQTVKIGNTQLLINKIMLIPYGTTFLKVFDWSPLEMNTFHGMWVEGIGSTIDLMNETPIWYDGCLNKELVSCECSGEELFNYATFETSLQQMSYYHPFIEDGKVWKVAHFYNELLPDYWTENYYFEGDTIIADIHCVKMMHGDAKYAGAVHEEGMKVGYFAPGSQSEALLYDFGVKVGDIVTPLMDYLGGHETFTCVITDVLTIQHDGENLRCIFLSPQEEVDYLDYQDQIFGVWVEGVGSTVCPVADVPLNMIPVGQFLHGCSIGGKELYSSGLSSAVRKAIQEVIRRTSINIIQADQKVNQELKNKIVYDLSGRRLSTSQPTRGGIYIFDGKKVVVK